MDIQEAVFHWVLLGENLALVLAILAFTLAGRRSVAVFVFLALGLVLLTIAAAALAGMPVSPGPMPMPGM